MKIIGFITESETIQKILNHIGLWKHKPSRDPPTETFEALIIYEPLHEDMTIEYEEFYIPID